MRHLIEKFSAGIKRLAFWHKPATPALEQPNASAAVETEAEPNKPDTGTAVETPVAHGGWFARLKQRLPWRRPPPPEQILDLDQTVVVARPSAEQLTSAEAADDTDASKPSLFTRLKNKLSRQSKLDPGMDSSNTESAPKTSDQNSEPTAVTDDMPKPDLLTRLRNIFSNKWVLISGATAMLLVMIGTVVILLLQAGHEKEKLKAELHEAKKKIEQQHVMLIQPPAPIKPLEPVIPSKTQAEPSPGGRMPATSRDNATNNSGDCMVSDKESVNRSLKDCIENFNQMASGSQRANRK